MVEKTVEKVKTRLRAENIWALYYINKSLYFFGIGFILKHAADQKAQHRSMLSLQDRSIYGDVISSGMRVEIEEATKLGIPILYRPGICPDERKNNAGTNTAKHRCLHYWI